MKDNNVKIEPASTVLLVRDKASHLEVLMMERAKTMAFMPGAFVFPGGKVDTADTDYAHWQGLVNVAETEDFPFKLAGLRELYEEASVLHTEKASKVSESDLSFRECLTTAGTPLDIASLVFFSHWITPEGGVRRYDTRFYLAPHNGDSILEDGAEAMSVEWVRPLELLDTWKADKKLLRFPTRLNLIKLSQAKTVSEAFSMFSKEQVVKTLPLWNKSKRGPSISQEVAEFHAYKLNSSS